MLLQKKPGTELMMVLEAEEEEKRVTDGVERNGTGVEVAVGIHEANIRGKSIETIWGGLEFNELEKTDGEEGSWMRGGLGWWVGVDRVGNGDVRFTPACGVADSLISFNFVGIASGAGVTREL
ncbi:hypothetical protein MLD38_022042 [Melastoma candidum]|uniref:Uncharacterized protein n=1 Tax=Melastoma candidum TaxID=119954 RepID=A0ACB9QLV2_9MYRT|nr:hypothetical protein MLD38_022042 [Melastoma candidum]